MSDYNDKELLRIEKNLRENYRLTSYGEQLVPKTGLCDHEYIMLDSIKNLFSLL